MVEGVPAGLEKEAWLNALFQLSWVSWAPKMRSLNICFFWSSLRPGGLCFPRLCILYYVPI